MVKGLIVYFVTEGPVWECDIYGNFVWQVKAQVSGDNGETCTSMVFTFAVEEHALTFRREVNSKMEPMILGEEE